MSNTIQDNPFLSQLFDVKEQNKNSKPGLQISELAQAKHDADQFAKQAKSADVSYAPSKQGAMAAARIEQVERAYQYSETMSMQLTTKEGDQVTVDFRQLYAQYQSYSEAQAGEQGPQGVRYFESKEALEMTQFEEQFGFAVQGDLNEDELKAIFDVFEQVDSLANQFFDGNIEKALQQAEELNIDFGQLDSFKLELTQTESLATSYQQAAVAQYNDVQQQSSEHEQPEQNGADVSELPPYLQQWQDAIERLDEQFKNAQEVLNGFMGEVTAQRFPEQDSPNGWLERVRVFHEQLIEMAKSDSRAAPEENSPDGSIELMPESESIENSSEQNV
ncbi:MAG TPA: hypothetical protein ENK73_04125 [Thiomicrospira sp.]|jgi:hypothetical protein|nr:hypothetical protein [Thiomicrospira sp.]